MNPVVCKRVSEPIRSVGRRRKPQKQKILEKIGKKKDEKKKKKKSKKAENQ